MRDLLKIRKIKGYTLFELLVCVLIVIILSFIAIPNLLSQIKSFKTKGDILAVSEMIKEARSIAINRSKTVYIDFSKADEPQGTKGGLIEIKENDGTVLSQVYLNSDILYNDTLSTIKDSVIKFNYRGEPADSTGSIAGFTDSSNSVAISYYNDGKVLNTKSLEISPITGNVSLN